MSSKLNAEWHQTHKMPKNPSLEQRVQWHAEHTKNCVCRKPTGVILDELKKRGLYTES